MTGPHEKGGPRAHAILPGGLPKERKESESTLPDGDLVGNGLAAILDRLERIEGELVALRRAAGPRLVTVAEAAEALGVSTRTVARWIRAGEVPVRRIGRSVRVDLAALRPLGDADVAQLAHAAREGGRP